MPQNADMFPLLRSRRLIWIALIAWLAQLFLPAAHATAMAQQQAGLATWCGDFSPAMTKKLAALPHDVREILQQGSERAGQHQDCMQVCTGAAPDGPASSSPTLVLRVAEFETLAAAAPDAVANGAALRPPVRGPPLGS